eukprot:15484111-Alexandrium_andersonii.AAC.1
MIGYGETISEWYRAVRLRQVKSCDQAGRARLRTLAAATQRRCFVVTHGECGADCARQAIEENLDCDVHAHEVTAETET